MTTLLILGHSKLAQKHLISAAKASGAFSHVEVASRREIHNGAVDKIYSDYDEALKQSEADVVYVSTVNSEHALWAKKVLGSGRHCIIDKPAFMTQKESVELSTLAVTKNLLLAEATVWALHPQCEKLLSYFEDKAATKGVALFSMPPFDENNFRWSQELGGGCLYDLGPYFASSGRFIFGGAAEEVKATILEYHKGVPLSFSVQARWPSGGSLIGHFGFDSEYVNRLEVFNLDQHAILNRIFTTPVDLENTLYLSQRNKTSTYNCPAANSFVCFFKKISKDIEKKSFQYWRQDLLDDAETMALLFEATHIKDEA